MIRLGWALAPLFAAPEVLLASECRVRLSGLQYPSLAAAARLQGTVKGTAVLADGQLTQWPALEGHPLLTQAVEAALGKALWEGCRNGDLELAVEFRLSDHCLHQPLLVEQAGPGTFRLSMSMPAPCIYSTWIRKARRWQFWKKPASGCDLICPPCDEPAAHSRSYAK